MKPILFFIACLFIQLVSAQENNASDSLENIYLSGLNCNSVILTTTYFEQLLPDSNGNKLITWKDSTLNKKLLSYLNDPSKTIAIHFILTKRIENYNRDLTIEYVYDSGYQHITRVNLDVNNFAWYLLVDESNKECGFHFNKIEMEKIRLYWSYKLYLLAHKLGKE